MRRVWPAGLSNVLNAGQPRRLARWSPRLLTGAVLVGALSLVALVDPHRSGRYPLCPWHAMTGTWCPGCGGLRAVHDLAHGQVAAAAGENLLVVALVPILALWWISTRVGPWSGRRRLVLNPRAVAFVAVVALTFTVLRNLPIGAGLAP